MERYYKKKSFDANMINVLQLCLSHGYGGLELYVDKTVNSLDKQQFKVHTVVHQGTFLHKRLIEKQIPVSTISNRIRYLPFLAAFCLARYIDRYDISIMHIHWGHDLFLAVMAKIISRRKPALVYVRHMALTRPKKDLYHRFLYSQVDAFVTITHELANDAKRYLPIDSQRILPIYLGVPKPAESAVDCSLLEKHNFLTDSFKIAIFGRIESGKGQNLIIDASIQLRQEGFPVQTAMIGHVMDKGYFAAINRQINDAGMQSHIKYLGFHAQPVKIMPCFDVIVLATKCETFGLVLPEAMRAGVAVIGSNCGGVPEIITHEKTGLLFETQNVDDLTAQLRRLLENPELCKQLASSGQKDADIRFSEERHYLQLSELYQSLCTA